MAAIPLLEPYLGGNERLYVEEALARNEIAQGAFVERFEREFAQYVGSRYAVAVSSGTAAIHLAMKVLGVGEGDGVYCPTLTFVATANPILYEGATPIFVDSEPATWHMDPAILCEALAEDERKRWGRAKAVIVAHLLGHVADINPIVEACDRYGIPVIEDACESLGARSFGRQVGSIGKIGCFSFNGNKIMTTGGGGMLVTNDEALATRARHLARQARLPGTAYQHDEAGFNYRLSNVAAAMGCAQLEQLPEFLTRKADIAEWYWSALPSGSAQHNGDGGVPSWWLYSAKVPHRDMTMKRLQLLGIESRPVWTPLHTLPMFAGAPYLGGKVAEEIFASAVSLPSSVTLRERDLRRVCDVLTLAAA